MSARRWPLPVLGGVLSTALGVAINIATDVGSNAWAWIAVAVLTGAGITVGLASGKLARAQADPPTRSTPVVEVSGNKNRVKVNLLGPGAIIAVGVVVIIAVTAGLLMGISTQAGPPPVAPVSMAPAAAEKPKPFTVTVLDDPTDDIDGFWRGSAGGYLFPSGTVSTLEAPSPATAYQCANWSHWALRKGGVRTFSTNIAFTVAAPGSDSVRVNTARLHVEPLPKKAIGDVIQCRQGGPIPYSRLSLDLDHQSASYLYPTTGPQAGQSRPFALEISAGHAEEVLVDARTRTCYCSWYLDLLIEVNGIQYSYRVDHGGKPFVVAPRDGDYTYFDYDEEELRWRPST